MLRENGFHDTIRKEFPNVTIAAEQFGMGDPERSRAAAENILTAAPDLAGIAYSAPSWVEIRMTWRAAPSLGSFRN